MRATSSRSSYRPLVEYAYAMDDKSHIGTHRVFGVEAIAYRSPLEAQAIADDYPLERAVQVYYAPANPETAILVPGRIGMVVKALVAGVVCLGLGLLTTWMVIAVALAPQPR